MTLTPADIRVRLDSSDPAADWNFGDSSSPSKTLWFDNQTGTAKLVSDDGERGEWNDPLAALDWMSQSVGDLQQPGRWIGYLSYDAGRWFERLPTKSADDLSLPHFIFSWHIRSPLPVIRERARVRACNKAFSDGQHIFRQPSPGLSGEGECTSPFSNFTPSAYESAVARVIEYVRAGDVFQVNLSQRFAVPIRESAADIYRRLPPAVYGACLDYGEFALICNSPELFFRVTPDRRIVTRPIKGTRPLGPGMKDELERSAKDQAELNMIVDLERNDLGRVCRIGSVNVTQPRIIEAHPTVYHGAASIEGALRDDVRFSDFLRAVFPGGSVTGAPKIRAMEIIEELEPVRRGPYCGAIGYLDSNGTIEFNVAIRTMITKDRTAYVPVGGGIVADSDPAQERRETLVKARAMFDALGVKHE